jgi:hypothetical protein
MNKGLFVIAILVTSLSVTYVPEVNGKIYVEWRLDITDNGEFLTAFAHLYGVPKVEQEYNLYFCEVDLDATTAVVPDEGIIELSVGDYAQPARIPYVLSQQEVYTYGLNPTFNNKIAEITSPTPITVDLKITDKSGTQLYADSKTIQMLPINYYAWVLVENDMRALSPVLSSFHAVPYMIFGIIIIDLSPYTC